MEKIIDITRTISSNMSMYPGVEKPVITKDHSFEMDGYNTRSLKLTTHTGTHCDAPAHMLSSGNTVDNLDMQDFITNGIIIKIDTKNEAGIGVNKISDAVNILKKYQSLILMTDWNYEGKEAFNEYTNFPHLTLEASDYIAKNLPDLHVIGINSPSIAINSNLSSNVENDVFETHRRLLLKNKLILEDLDLKYFQKSNDNAIEGTLFFAPLKILEGDGGPCRAIFILKDNKI